MRLYTFAMSHYSEKIRWVLDHSHLPYEEVCMTPVFHIRPALKMGGRGQTTLPILQAGDQYVQDSRRIVLWLEQNKGQLALLPTSDRDLILKTCEKFDQMGRDVARFLYANSFGRSDAHILRLWTEHASVWQKLVIKTAYPLIRKGFERKLGIHKPQGVERARQRIEEAVTWLDGKVQHLPIHEPFLLGAKLSLADVTAASLLAPIACPAQHPIYGDADYKQAMLAATNPWQSRPAMKWVRQLYSEHRLNAMA